MSQQPLADPLAAPIRLEGSGRAGVVLLHGWTGSPAHLRMLADALHDRGHSIVAPLLAGHGTAVGDMLGTSWRDWLRSAAEGAQEVVDSGKTLHLVGLSMGGILSLLLAPVFGAASVTTISAPMKVYDRFAPHSWLVRGSTRLRPHEPVALAGDGVDRFRVQYDHSPVGTVADLFDLIRAARATLGRVTCPALVIQSRADQTVRPESASILRDGLSGTRARVVWLERAGHVALLDEERSVIHREVAAHIASAS
ncbi:MAG: alpha/beta hydrolase [Acidimicrobiia bacterium]